MNENNQSITLRRLRPIKYVDTPMNNKTNPKRIFFINKNLFMHIIYSFSAIL
jgi:hypothetical protein